MIYRKPTILLLVVLIALFLHVNVHPAAAIGVANVEVTNVYWGSDPTNPETAHPGDVNLQLSILITNVGDDVARSVNATLMIGPPLIYQYSFNGVMYNGTAISKFAGDMPAGQSYTLLYTLSIDPKAVEGIYQYELQLSYSSARELQEIANTVNVTVPIWRGELHVQGVSTNPTKMYPDSKAVDVTVTIVNSGQGLAKDIQLDLILTPPFSPSSSGSDEIFIGNLPAGQTTNANFVVDVAQNATFGQYSVMLVHPVENELIPIGQVPLYVAEKVKFQIVSATPSTINVGDSGDVISVAIRNTGTVEADSVRVEVETGNFFTGTLTDFLGTMLANETKVAFFTVDVDSKTVPGQYTVNFRFDWTQGTDSLSDDYSCFTTITVLPPPLPVILIVVALVVVVGAGGYLYNKKRKARKELQHSTKTNK